MVFEAVAYGLTCAVNSPGLLWEIYDRLPVLDRARVLAEPAREIGCIYVSALSARVQTEPAAGVCGGLRLGPRARRRGRSASSAARAAH